MNMDINFEFWIKIRDSDKRGMKNPAGGEWKNREHGEQKNSGEWKIPGHGNPRGF